MKRIFSSLYWRISAAFLLLLLLVGFAYVMITANSAERYFQDKHQRLNAEIAKQVVKEIGPFINGEVSEERVHQIMVYMMAINPAIEVYLLDPTGRILSYVAPYKKVKLEQVNLAPILTFIDSTTTISSCILGDDPRNPGITKVFSAAPVQENGIIVGYVYIVLASEEYDSVTQSLLGSYLTSLSSKSILFTLGASMIIALLVIWLVTRNLRSIIETVRRFQQGDFQARIPIRSQDELSELARTFNEMADTIVADNEKRENLDQLRRELVANVSHDLRTPLSVVHGYIETLLIKEDTLSDTDRRAYMQIILNSIGKLEKLVSELFELSRLESDQIQPQKEPFAMTELIQDIIHKYELLAREKGVILEPQLSKDLSIVEADVALIERVLQNLIDNAIKFTPKGGTITVSIDKKEDQIEVKVADTGPGIPETDLPYVFDRYHKGGKQSQTNPTGSGLGLAIVKKILEIHDSHVRLQSLPGEGAVFSFQLPIYAQLTHRSSPTKA